MDWKLWLPFVGVYGIMVLVYYLFLRGVSILNFEQEENDQLTN